MLYIYTLYQFHRETIVYWNANYSGLKRLLKFA